MLVKINENKEMVVNIIKAINDNDGYCPNATEKNEDTKCQCLDFRNQESGYCHCGLYIKIKEE